MEVPRPHRRARPNNSFARESQGKQHMSFGGTVALGVVAAVIGGLIWNAVFPDNDGIAWIGAIIVAVILVWLYAKLAPRRASGAGSGDVRGGPSMRPGRRRLH